MLPLFVAAGSVMAPTVILGGLATARPRWHPIVRTLCFLIAAGPAVFVGTDLIGSFSWSLHTLAGFVLMVALYATIIRATRFTFGPQRTESSSPP